MFIRRESFRQFLDRYPVTSIIIGINTFLFLLHFFPFLYQPLYLWGVGSNEAVSAGQYWRLVTPIFLHGSLMHFVFNTFALVIFAPALEYIVGKLKFTLTYLAAGIVGNVGTYFLAQLRPSYLGAQGASAGDFVFPAMDYLHLGASGSLYGLLGLYLFMVFSRQDLIDAVSRQITTTILIIGAAHTVIMPGINLYAHLFGFIGGLALGPLVLSGNVRPFSSVALSIQRRSTLDKDVVAFDPRRWQKRPTRKKWGKMFFIIFIILVILGLLSTFFD